MQSKLINKDATINAIKRRKYGNYGLKEKEWDAFLHGIDAAINAVASMPVVENFPTAEKENSK